MASNRERDRDRENPSSSSSPISVSDPRDSFLSDPNSHLGGSASASGSFQNEGLLSDFSASISDADFGFSRPEFRQSPLVGTVDFYDRHVFLCYKNPKVWPPRIEAAEFDRLPRLLSAAVMARKGDMKKETRLTICEGHDGAETSNGDVLIFPDMIRYRRLTHFDVDTFVEEVLVKNGEWQPGTPEALKGSYVFVCCHGSRDRRCGVCGPNLVSRFREEIELLGLKNEVSVSPCSHIGGHKYAGNVIIFGPNANREVSGHWYGYVTPEDVHLLLQHHIVKGKIVNELWRGQMGLSEEEQKISLESRLRLNGGTNNHQNKEELAQIQTSSLNTDTDLYGSRVEVAACCQGEGHSSCCQNPVQQEKPSNSHTNDICLNVSAKTNRKHISRVNSGKGASRKVCAMPTWLESWEHEDTYAVVAVVCAVVSIAVAYSCYKQL